MWYASWKTIILKAKLNAADTSLTADIDVWVTSGRLYFVNDLQEEWVAFTGVAASGSNFVYSGLTRGLSQTADPITAGTGLTWIAGNSGALVAMHDQLWDKQQGWPFASKTTAELAARTNKVAWETFINSDTSLLVYWDWVSYVSIWAVSTNFVLKTWDTITGLMKGAKSTDIASATTTDLSTLTGNYAHVTGVTTITSFGTVTAWTQITLVFDWALILTHNGTSLILPTADNITTVAGDSAVFESEWSGNWKCVNYQRKDGTALASSVLPETRTTFVAWENITIWEALYLSNWAWSRTSGRVYKATSVLTTYSDAWNFIWFATETITSWNNIIVSTAWINSNQSGLTNSSKYYLTSTPWSISTTYSLFKVWRAVSATQILINASWVNNWYELLDRSSLWSWATSLTSGTFEWRKNLLVRIYIPSTNATASAEPTLRFNWDTWFNYSFLNSQDWWAWAWLNSTNQVTLQVTTARTTANLDQTTITVNITNISSVAKMGNVQSVHMSWASWLTPRIDVGGFQWNNTSALITSISLLTKWLTANLATGTTMEIYWAD